MLCVNTGAEGKGKQQWSESTHPSAKRPYHSDDLQVLQIRPLRGQQLFGNEVCFVSGEPLKRMEEIKTEREGGRQRDKQKETGTDGDSQRKRQTDRQR